MIGIVFATEREAKPFLDKLSILRQAQDDSDLVMVSSSNHRQDFYGNFVVLICGMGPEKAVDSLKEFVKKYKIETIINVGIAGALKANFEIGHIVNVSHAVSLLSNEKYTLDEELFFSDLPSAVLATSKDPVFDDSLREKFSKIADIVDMEGAEIARFCEAQKIKFSAIKAVSDFAGTGDRGKLYENIDRLSEKLAEILVRTLTPAPLPGGEGLTNYD